MIETNVRQRGDVSSSSLKMGRIICELEKIYGVRHGGDKLHNVQLATQENISEQLGLDKRSYANYKKLTTLIPEFQDMVDDKISPSVASRLVARLSAEDQEELLSSLPVAEKLTQKAVQGYVNQNNNLGAGTLARYDVVMHSNNVKVK